VAGFKSEMVAAFDWNLHAIALADLGLMALAVRC